MYREMLKSKIHRATVTQADLRYVGSLTLDWLMAAANLLPERRPPSSTSTKAPGSAPTSSRGWPTAALSASTVRRRLISPGDLGDHHLVRGDTEEQARSYRPSVVFVDGGN